MIICILECSGDEQPQVWFMDTDKLDTNNNDHNIYKEAVDKALADPLAVIGVDYGHSFSSGGSDMGNYTSRPPCYVDASVEIFI